MLGVLVVIHEFGHFVVARLARRHASTSSASASRRARKVLAIDGETLYTLNWLPIGGFVRLEGEDGESDDPRSFVRAAAADHELVDPARRRADEPPACVRHLLRASPGCRDARRSVSASARSRPESPAAGSRASRPATTILTRRRPASSSFFGDVDPGRHPRAAPARRSRSSVRTRRADPHRSP